MDSTLNASCFQPEARRINNSRDASAASKWKPSCSRRLRSSITEFTAGPSRDNPNSSAFTSMVARPAISLTTNRVPFPTTTGSTCSYASFARLIAETCNPALCANAEEPTYGACGFSGLFKTSATWLLTAVRRSRFPSGRQRNPIFNSRFGITVVRFVLPVRSPRPFSVPCT